MIAFVVLGLSLFFAISVHAIPTVRLELPSLVNPGQTFTLDVFADGVTDIDPFFGLDELIAFGFDVVFPAPFTFNGATVGPLFNDDSASFSNTDVAGSALPGISGTNILLASLSFTSSIPGNFFLGIFSDLSDPNEGLIIFPGPSINMTASKDVTVTPEPGTLLLLGSGGLVGLAFRKKLRRVKA